MGQTIGQERLNATTIVKHRQMGPVKSVWLTQHAPAGMSAGTYTVTVPMEDVPALVAVLKSMHRSHIMTEAGL